MNDMFFPELARRLKREGIDTGPVEKERLPVLLGGQEVMLVASGGTIFLKPETADDQPVINAYDIVAGISAQVREYTTAIEAAPRLKAEGLHENFHLLSEYNGLVLAGREMAGGLGYEFATWWYTYDRTGVTQGNYHYDYDAAKLDFACRSGLVERNRTDGAPAKAPFSFRGERRGKGVQWGMPEGRSPRNGLCLDDEQLTELYRCIAETLDSGYPITREREKTLRSAMEQIESSVDDLEERVEQSNQRDLEAAEQQADGEPGMEMAP